MTRDPDRLRDEIANGDREPPPGWPGRVGTATPLRRFTDAEKYECAKREVMWRKRVYPNRVFMGKIPQQQADREIATMQEIADDYRAKTELPL
jgi:hypothetical protein